MTAIAIDTPKSVSPTWRRFRDAFRRHPTAIIGGAVLLAMILVALLAPWLGTVDPQAVTPIKRLRQPSAEFWFGTDMLGRDVYSRVIYGTRVSLTVGVVSAGLALATGAVIGVVAGFYRGRIDNLLMRAIDILMGFPEILLAIALVAALGPGLTNAMLAVAVEILCCGLTGAALSSEMESLHLATGAPLRSGQCFVALNPDAIVGFDSYLKRAETLVEAMLAEEGVRLPGARRCALRAESLREGVEIEERVFRELERLAAR